MNGNFDSSRFIEKHVPRLKKEIIQGYRSLPPGDVAGLVARVLDQIGVNGTIPSTILRPVRSGEVLIGPAITVRKIPERQIPFCSLKGREYVPFWELEAFVLAQEGDIVVIDGSAVFPSSCLGLMEVTIASKLGVAGIIVSGMVTDLANELAAGMPIWARGNTIMAGDHRVETIEINGVIGLEGLRVEPRDLIVADDSGVTIVPHRLAGQVLTLVNKMRAKGAGLRSLLDGENDRETLYEQMSLFLKMLMQSSSSEEQPE